MAKSRQLAALLRELRESQGEYLLSLSPEDRRSMQNFFDQAVNPMDVESVGRIIREAPRTPRDLVTYRGAKGRERRLAPFGDRPGHLLTPTALDPEYAAFFGQVDEIEVPAGSPALYTDPLRKRGQRESELILPGHTRYEAAGRRRLRAKPPYRARGGRVNRGTI